MNVRSLLYGLLLTAATSVSAAPFTTFYVVAHPDDWQLFMNPNAYKDVRNTSNKTVIVHTTAGDAGAGIGSNGRQHPYYLAREEGALRALRFSKSANGAIGQQVLNQGARTINGRSITRFASGDGRAVMYFLRLPDGNPNGTGYPTTGSQSLQKLKTGNTPINAVDGSATYGSWSDLTATLAGLIRAEAGGSAGVWLNIAETDAGKNPGDHSDHRYTSLAVQEARGLVSTCIDQALYVEYHTNNRPANISGDNLVNNAAVWGATTSGIADFDHPSTFDGSHNAWLSRNYFRVIDGIGTCAF
ncbi:PIG-L family deacetylase [Dokdonella koreensis]|uniref:GlcNAc-PI de-N-acetylase n=1 Tax=Dokdonella koreensis DS-123 TaxID=1300342 RepID=A0A167GD65_9GAMM|nr:PIG-L family deacetylase [Dokdonella koreensis]ANB16432.1 Hypothetical protein I596_395 [Dokdonella koreensis DS-123]